MRVNENSIMQVIFKIYMDDGFNSVRSLQEAQTESNRMLRELDAYSSSLRLSRIQDGWLIQITYKSQLNNYNNENAI